MSSFGYAPSGARDRVVLIACLVLLSAFAWVALWWAERSHFGFLHQHHLHHSISSPSAMFLFIAGWTVMTVAMMLPTTMPVLTILHTFARARKDRALLVGLAVLGYLIAWALFGGVAYLAGILLHEVVSASAFAPAAGGTPVVLLVAGAFQFSSLKHRCLDKCRSPMSFVIGHWRGRRQRWESFRLGWRHGLFCVGCCWALMSLMFVVSSGSLLWMFLLAAIMAVEKNVSWGRRISRPVGVALLAWATALLLGPLAL